MAVIGRHTKRRLSQSSCRRLRGRSRNGRLPRRMNLGHDSLDLSLLDHRARWNERLLIFSHNGG